MIEWSNALIQDEQGNALYLVTVGIDIHETYLYEEQLRQTNHHLKALTQHVPGVVYSFQMFEDGRSCFSYASEHLEDIYGI